MMDFEKIIHAFIEQGEWEKGRKLFDLSPEFMAEHELLFSQARALVQEQNRINFEMRKIDLKIEEWWNKLRAQHHLGQAPHIRYEDGVVYEYIRKEVKS